MPSGRGTAFTPRNLLGVAVAIGVYLIAYRHGRLSTVAPSCACGADASSEHSRREDELLQAMPATERAMLSCLLQRAETRQVVRHRLHACIADRGVLDPASAAQLRIPPPSPPPPSPAAVLHAAEGVALLPQVRPGVEVPTTQAGMAIAASPPPLDPLLNALRIAADAEAELPSAPLHGRPAASAAQGQGAEVLGAAAAATTNGRLVTISCEANSRLLIVDPTTGWAQCSGDASSSGSELLGGVFAQEVVQPSMQLAFKHLASGKYLQIVPPGGQPAWVVRAHSSVIGDAEHFEVRSGRGGHTYLFNVASGAHLNHRFGFTVRGHGDRPGKPAGRVPSSRVSLRYYTLAQLRAEHSAALTRQAAAREPIRAQLTRIHALAASNEVRIISYGLYGANSRYTIGVLRNAQLAPIVYPGWRVRATPRAHRRHSAPVARVTRCERVVRRDASGWCGAMRAGGAVTARRAPVAWCPIHRRPSCRAIVRRAHKCSCAAHKCSCA